MDRIHINDLIAGLNINEKMKQEFKNFNFMYYTNYIDGKIKQPYTWERSQAYIDLSKINKEQAWAITPYGSLLPFFIGPFAYFFKGMPLKGFIYTTILFTIALSAPDSLNYTVKFIGSVAIIYFVTVIKRDEFFEKCLKNPKIKQLASDGKINFAPDEEHLPVKLNKMEYSKVKRISIMVLVSIIVCILLSIILISVFDLLIQH